MVLVLPRFLAIGIFTAASAFAPPAAAAQQAPAGPKPYKPVEVSVPAPPSDKTLEAFRKQLSGIVQRKDRAALARLVVVKDFFWESDFGGMFQAKKSGFDNLATALRIAEPDGRGWAALAAFAIEATVGHSALNPHSLCAPARPDYDDAELATLTEATNTDVVDWIYSRTPGLQVRAAAANDAAVIETLGVHLVRMLGIEGRERGWTRIATPGGKIGYVPSRMLLSPIADRLCFGKDASGWHITGYVGGGD